MTAGLTVHEPSYVDTTRGADQFLAAVEQSTTVAVDTEGASFHRFVDRIYLLQMSTREITAVLDPLAIGKPVALGRILESDTIEKVFHDADYDLRLLHQDYGWNTRRLFDTRVAAQLLPPLNATGASSRQIKDAVLLATEHASPSITFEQTARLAATKQTWREYGKGALFGLIPLEVRLSLEMASHEESERRALEGELHLLEEAWKEAEEIAAISDDLFLPEDISKRLTEMKGR